MTVEESFEKLYLIFRANYYKRMVEKIGPREGSLSATESYCVEIIYLLNEPTVSEFANFLGISVPNANYKIGGLVEKGYVIKRPSTEDRREYHLVVTDKFLDYYGLKDKDIARLVRKIRTNCTNEEMDQMERMIQLIIRFLGEEDEND